MSVGVESTVAPPKMGAEESGDVRWTKRLMDIGLILFLSPVVLVLGILVGGVILCVLRGSVFYGQTRIGLKGRLFTCWKFRTMKLNAETGPHEAYVMELIRKGLPMTKLDAGKDDRLILFGGALRSSGLDELPQLFNVLRGEMSLVGPRPCLPCEYENYSENERRRFDVLPGITGLWQVSGKNETTFKEMIRLDNRYVEQQSVRLDVEILARTLKTVFGEVRKANLRRKQRDAVSK